MTKKVTGILTLSVVLLTIVLALLTLSQGEFFPAFNVQLLMVMFTLCVVTGGTYLLKAYAPHTKKGTKLMLAVFGLILLTISTLCSFNIIDFLSTYNWLISIGIFYILLVQLQLLRWGKPSGIITRICAILLILSNLFLVVFFIAKWRYAGIGLWIDIAVLTSLSGFLIGFITLKRQPETVLEENRAAEV